MANNSSGNVGEDCYRSFPRERADFGQHVLEVWLFKKGRSYEQVTVRPPPCELSYTRKINSGLPESSARMQNEMAKAATKANVSGSETTAPILDHRLVGDHLRQARKARGLTLVELSKRSGIAVSTISKTERGDIALTYDKFAALAHSLELDFDAIFGRSRKRAAGAMTPSFTANGNQENYDTPNYVYGMLANNLTGKRMVPVRVQIKARAVSDFPDYIRHSGEEFVFLLDGKLELRFETGSSFKLVPGDSLYFDSSVGHVYLSLGKKDAEALVCCFDTDGHRPDGTI